MLDLYDHRKKFRTTAHTLGGYRYAIRKQLEERYDKSSSSFTRSFKVCHLVDCCAASAGLACGISFSTWTSSRADVRLGRSTHQERSATRSRVERESPPERLYQRFERIDGGAQGWQRSHQQMAYRQATSLKEMGGVQEIEATARITSHRFDTLVHEAVE